MQLDDLPEFNERLTACYSYYRQDVSEFVLTVWWQACQRYDLEQFQKAINSHVTDPDKGQFCPKIADLVRILEGTSTEKAQLAWGKVMDAAQRIGAYQDVVFDDPAIHAAAHDLGGWPKICRTELDDLGYLQHRFCESYRAYQKKEGFAHPHILIGDRSSDDVYKARGLPLPKPVPVGDRGLARIVYKQGEKRAYHAPKLEDIASKVLSGA